MPLRKFQAIIFDFDGVILDSMLIRTEAFAYALRNYPQYQIDKLIEYHLYNGGLSRFHKFQYFFEHILHQSLDERKLKQLLHDFGLYVKEHIINPTFIIHETIEYISHNHAKQQFFIASGSEQEELRYICQSLDIGRFFVGIFGSPTHKNQIVANILKDYSLLMEDTALIGDSINDLEAAKYNQIEFYGYNNMELKKLKACKNYLNDFTNIHP